MLLPVRGIYLSTAGSESKWRLLYRGISILVCLVCFSRLWCAATIIIYKVLWEPRVGETFITLREILNRDQLVKYWDCVVTNYCERIPQAASDTTQGSQRNTRIDWNPILAYIALRSTNQRTKKITRCVVLNFILRVQPAISKTARA